MSEKLRTAVNKMLRRSTSKAKQSARKYNFQMERFHLGKKAAYEEVLALLRTSGDVKQ